MLLDPIDRLASHMGLSVSRNRSSIQIRLGPNKCLVIDAELSEFPFNEEEIEKAERVLLLYVGNKPSKQWHACPQLKEKATQVSPAQLLRKLVAEKSYSIELYSETKNAAIETCDVTCVFGEQLSTNLGMIKHDMFGTVSTFGSAKRVMEGVGSEKDLAIFRERLSKLVLQVEARQPRCRFLVEKNDRSTEAARLLLRMEQLCSKPLAKELANAIRELKTIVQA